MLIWVAILTTGFFSSCAYAEKHSSRERSRIFLTHFVDQEILAISGRAPGPGHQRRAHPELGPIISEFVAGFRERSVPRESLEIFEAFLYRYAAFINPKTKTEILSDQALLSGILGFIAAGYDRLSPDSSTYQDAMLQLDAEALRVYTHSTLNFAKLKLNFWQSIPPIRRHSIRRLRLRSGTLRIRLGRSRGATLAADSHLDIMPNLPQVMTRMICLNEFSALASPNPH